nr:gamma-glutamylcyclotransferase [Mycobacterium sp.]
WLHGWRLTFAGEDIGWEGALATLVEDVAASVFVVLYDVTPADEANMDRWEGSELGLHKKIRCRIARESSDTTTDPVLAWLYVVDAWEGGLPSARYLGVMSDAAEVAGAPADYVHDIRTRPARNIGPGPAD